MGNKDRSLRFELRVGESSMQQQAVSPVDDNLFDKITGKGPLDIGRS